MAKVLVLSDLQHQMLNAALINTLVNDGVKELAREMEMPYDGTIANEFRKMQQMVENHGNEAVVLLSGCDDVPAVDGIFVNEAAVVEHMRKMFNDSEGDSGVSSMTMLDVLAHKHEYYDVQKVEAK